MASATCLLKKQAKRQVLNSKSRKVTRQSFSRDEFLDLKAEQNFKTGDRTGYCFGTLSCEKIVTGPVYSV
jgi:hypothetical protein